MAVVGVARGAGLLLWAVWASTVHISAFPTTASTASTASTPSLGLDSAAAAVGDLELCGAQAGQPVRLTAGPSSASSEVRVVLTPPRQPHQPCRLEVAAPPSNYLSLTLEPVPKSSMSASAPNEEVPDEDDDAYNLPRARVLATMLGMRPDEDESGSSNASRAANGNLGMVFADLVHRGADRKGNTINASCTLALFVEGEVAWAVDLCDARAVESANAHLANMPNTNNLTLAWTPPESGRRLQAVAIRVTAARKGLLPATDLCSLRTVRLASKGIESAMALELSQDHDGPCRLNVAAPSTHLLSLLLVRTTSSPSSGSSSSSHSDELVADPQKDQDMAIDTDLVDDAEDAVMTVTRPTCGLSLLVACTTEVWSVDLCDPAADAVLDFTELFPYNVTLVWNPPPESRRASQVATTVILTAVGKGEMCATSQFLPCWRRPRSQPLCVASELACDGHRNCPLDGDDEDPAMCQPNRRLIESTGHERDTGVPQSSQDAKEYLLELVALYNGQQHNNHSSRSHETSSHGDGSPDTLSNYGPWGYLMLGMLVCGAFLMLCGLWECCCRQPKATPSAPSLSHTPTTVLMPQVGATGGVLMLDSDLDDDPSRPPPYDDLDQPPAYGALFPPGEPKDDVPTIVVMSQQMTTDSNSSSGSSSPTALLANASFPDVDADDVPSMRSSASSVSLASAASLALAPS